MTFMLILVGAIVGGWLGAVVVGADIGFLGMCVGVLLGWLTSRQIKLARRVEALETALKSTAAPPSSTRPAFAEAVPVATPVAAAAKPPAAPVSSIEPTVESESAPLDIGDVMPATVPERAAAEPVPAMETAIRRPEAAPPAPENAAWLWLKRWFSEGNVPVKVGVIVLFFGVAYLLKYAADQGWLRLPIEFRFIGVAVAALAALGFAWRKRESHRAFALSLQGGAIGVLILTAFIAYRLYNLIPAPLAFALLVVIVAGAGLLAVLQNASGLAVLAITGGFLAPVLVATNSGNHVALFGYYAVLNAAIFAIAWFRSWRALNLLGFAFTFGIGTFWGALQYRPELFASTEPFLLLFFAFYLLLPIAYARRQAAERRDLIDGSLVFGTPLIAFALQAALLDGERMPLAFSALGAAAIYAGLAILELRRWRFVLLGESHALLALGFATLAVPLALSARTTASTFALEGAGLIWLGLRQQRRIPRWIGYALQGLAGFAFLFGYQDAVDARPLLNGQYFGALILALAGLVSSRLLANSAKATDEMRRNLSIVFFAWGAAWWYISGGNEIGRFAQVMWRADWWLAFFAISALVAVELHRRLTWRECQILAAASIPIALPFIGIDLLSGHGVLESWHCPAWLLWAAASLRTLLSLSDDRPIAARVLHAVFWWIVVLVTGTELAYVANVHAQLGEVWTGLAGLAPAAVLYLLVLRRAALVRWPIDSNADATRNELLASLAVLLGIGWLLGLFHVGLPSRLAYVPVLNPLELAQIGYLILLALWYRQAESEGNALMSAEFRARTLAIAGLVLLTSVTLRGVHFFGDVPWSEALADSPLAQAALSIVWTLAGIAAMLLGKRRGSRAIWFGGAALMALVLLKLLLIDRNYLHDLPAIIGVLVVGLLLVTVGYFAPVPPKSTMEKAA